MEIKNIQGLLKSDKEKRYQAYSMLFDNNVKTSLLNSIVSGYKTDKIKKEVLKDLFNAMKSDLEYERLSIIFDSSNPHELDGLIALCDLHDCFEDSEFLCNLYKKSKDKMKKVEYKKIICSFVTIPPTSLIDIMDDFINKSNFLERIRPVFSHYDNNMRTKGFELISLVNSKYIIDFYVDMMKIEEKPEVISSAIKLTKKYSPENTLNILGKSLDFLSEDFQEDLDSIFREIASNNTKLYLDFMNNIKDDKDKLAKAGNTLKKLIDIKYLHAITDVVLNASSTYQLNSFFSAVENIISYYHEKSNIIDDETHVKECLSELERLLNIKDFLVRKKVIKILLKFKSPGLKVIMSYFGNAPKYDKGYLEELFQNTSASILFPVLEKIVATRDVSAIIPMIELVKKSGLKEYIKLIVQSMALDIPELKEPASSAAIELGYGEIYKKLCSNEDKKIRYWSCYLLKNFPDKKNLEIIKERLYDPEIEIRKVAVGVLFYYQKFSEIYSLLEETFDDPSEEIQEKTITTLGEIGNDAAFALMQKKIGTLSSKPLKDKVIEFITKKKKTEFLENYDSYSHEKKEIIAKSIYKLDKRLIEDIRKKQSSLDRNERFRAAEILSTITSRDDAVLVPLLLKSASDPDKKIRAIITDALGKSGNKTSHRTLLKLLNDPNARVRANVVESLEKYGNKEEVIALLIPFLKDKNNRVRSNTIVALWRLGYKDVFHVLKEMLESTDDIVISSALYAIRNIDYNSNLDFLRAYFKTKSSILKFNLLLTIEEFGIKQKFIREINEIAISNDKRASEKAKELLKI